MPEQPINRIQTPVELAAKLFAEQSEKLVGQLLGPQQPVRRQMVGDIPQDVVVDEVLKDLENI